MLILLRSEVGDDARCAYMAWKEHVMSSLPFRPRKTFKNRHWQDCFVSWLTSVYEDNSHSISSFADCHSTVHRFFTSIDKPPDQVTSDDVRYFINGSCFGRN